MVEEVAGIRAGDIANTSIENDGTKVKSILKKPGRLLFVHALWIAQTGILVLIVT